MARSDSPSRRTQRPVGVDVGGTFTDFVVATPDGLRVHKEPTTRPQHEAVEEGLAVVGNGPLVHGTTTVTNVLLERRGARVALMTTEGIGDVLAIGRQNRANLYDLEPSRSDPLVPSERRYEISERRDADGTVVTPLAEANVRRVAEALLEEGVESVAIAFLFSYQNSNAEERVATLLREEGIEVPITRSGALLPEHREYERTATTVVNAYVRPVMERYLARLNDVAGSHSVRVMQSNGGTIGADTAAREAARLALSGPAGGVVGALGMARQSGRLSGDAPQILTLDMGGTSADVALCDGEVPRTVEHTIAGLPLRLPATDIHTVGAGGGSIARVDEGGSLRVGPESAGAEPGPVCYGRGGTDPTVTDAHLVLGRLHPGYVLGGADTLDMAPEAAADAVTEVGKAANLSTVEAALGILRVANATMERALRRVSVERGHDPRDYTLVAFGGAGPLHAPALADALGIQQILVPPSPGVLSALGLLMADVVYDTSRAVLCRADALARDLRPLQRATEAAAHTVREVLDPHGASTLSVELDLRYAGQSYELSVPLRTPIQSDVVEGAVETFHEKHRRRYGHANPNEAVEVVTVRVRGHVETPSPDLPEESETDLALEQAVIGTRSVWFQADGPSETTIYSRSGLHHGHAFEGPAIVHQYDTTLAVPPGWHAEVDALQNIWIQR